jgi:hypothetical protein
MNLEELALNYSVARDKVKHAEVALDNCTGDELDRAFITVQLRHAALEVAQAHKALLQGALESARAPF